jgi:hypothetical protein
MKKKNLKSDDAIDFNKENILKDDIENEENQALIY